jgi:hypothetical protein
MQPRRSLRLVAGALVLALPLLGSCGFDKATDRVYTPGAGVNYRDGDIKVLSAVIVAAQADSGTFIATLSNDTPKLENVTLTGVAGAGDWSDLTVEPSDLSVEIPARGFVNLVDEDPITVRGDFTPGQVVELTLTFDTGDSATMDVPVVYACNYYEGLDRSASEPSESASPSESPSPGEVSESPSDSASSSASAAPSAGAPYECSAVGEG